VLALVINYYHVCLSDCTPGLPVWRRPAGRVSYAGSIDTHFGPGNGSPVATNVVLVLVVVGVLVVIRFSKY